MVHRPSHISGSRRGTARGKQAQTFERSRGGVYLPPASILTNRRSRPSQRWMRPPRRPRPCRRSRPAPASPRARRPRIARLAQLPHALVPPRLGPGRVRRSPARLRLAPGPPPPGPPPRSARLRRWLLRLGHVLVADDHHAGDVGERCLNARTGIRDATLSLGRSGLGRSGLGFELRLGVVQVIVEHERPDASPITAATATPAMIIHATGRLCVAPSRCGGTSGVLAAGCSGGEESSSCSSPGSSRQLRRHRDAEPLLGRNPICRRLGFLVCGTYSRLRKPP